MKKFSAIMLSLLTIPVYAQSILGSLQEYQNEIKPKANTSEIGEKSNLKIEPVEKSNQSVMCTEKEQTSLPLAYITGLMMEKDGKLDIQHDSRSGKLTIKSPDMISNCSSMIEFMADVKTNDDGKKIYSIEAKIKKGENCVDGKCTYTVAKVEKGQFKDFEKLQIAPNMVGFEQCLKDAGVIKDGKVDPEAIYPSTINEKFSGYKESGELLFLSHGPSSSLVRPKYGTNFVEIDECDYFERISEGGIDLQSTEEEEAARILAEKEKIRNCGEYEKIADFIERYQGYSEDLNAVRDALILDAVKKANANIAAGKYGEEDLKALADFEKYVVLPKIAKAEALYLEAEALPEGSSEQKARIDQMKAVTSQLSGYLKAPFLTPGLLTKLETDGLFDDALKVRGMGELIVKFNGVGLSNNQMSPSAARSEAAIITDKYKKDLVGKKEKFDITHGQSEGCFGMSCSEYYRREAQKYSQNMQVRTQNFTQAIYEEYARMRQPTGACYKPFRNVNRCIQEAQARIQELQAQMQHFNAQDAKFSAEATTKSKEYAELEKQGRAYVARQNGEEPPVEVPTANNTSPTPRTDDNSQGYNFEYQGYSQNQMSQNNQQYNQQMYQQPQQQQYYNPYSQFSQPQYNQQYSGQFNIGANSGMGNQQQVYNQYGGYQQPMYQQQQNNYWSNPYQAMGNYNMYGNR